MKNVALDPLPHLRDPYTYSKICQEQIAWEAWAEYRLPLVVIRPGVIYGPGRDCLGGRVGIRLGKLMVVMGGRQQMPYTHVANCAAAIVRAGTQAGVEGKAFNIVDDELPTGRDLTRQYRSKVGGIRRVVLPRWAVAAASRLSVWYHKNRGPTPGDIDAVQKPGDVETAAVFEMNRPDRASAGRLESTSRPGSVKHLRGSNGPARRQPRVDTPET